MENSSKQGNTNETLNFSSQTLSKSKKIYGVHPDKDSYLKKQKEENTHLFNNSQDKIISTFDSIVEKIDELINKLKEFKNISVDLKTSISKQISLISNQNDDNNINDNKTNTNETLEEKENEKNSKRLSTINDKLNEIHKEINTYFNIIKSEIEEISLINYEISNKNDEESFSLINSSNLNSFKKDEIIINNNFNYNLKVTSDIFVQNAICNFGLDNQFEFVEYNGDNYLLIYINNYNDLILKLIKKVKGEIINTLIIKNIFPDFIREVRYLSHDFEIKLVDEDDTSQDDNINRNNMSNIKKEKKNYLLVSSKKNEVIIFEVLILNSMNFENTLKKICHIENIYQKQYECQNPNYFHLSSCVLHLIKSNYKESELITTCWEGNSIKIYDIYSQIFKTEIISKTSCNIKYIELIEDKYLLFCGDNKSDNYTCVNRIDISSIDYSKQINENINFIKYSDKSEENIDNVHYHLYIYKKGNKKYLIECDIKGYLRMFNFDERDLIYKMYPSAINIKYKYEDTIYQIKRLNNINEWDDNRLFVTERYTGNIFIIEIKVDDDIKLEVKNIFKIFTAEAISIRKCFSNQFLILGKDDSDNSKDEIELGKIELIKKIKIDYE